MCKGCGGILPPQERPRNPRKWCSEACRISYIRRNRPDYVERNRAQAIERHLRTFVPKTTDLMCVVCGSTFTATRSNKMYCSKPCRYRAAYWGRRGRQAGVEREPYTLAEIAKRDGWRCSICGDPVDSALFYPDPMAPSIDHVVPLALGGDDTTANVALAHLRCNWLKGDRITTGQLQLI